MENFDPERNESNKNIFFPVIRRKIKEYRSNTATNLEISYSKNGSIDIRKFQSNFKKIVSFCARNAGSNFDIKVPYQNVLADITNELETNTGIFWLKRFEKPRRNLFLERPHSIFFLLAFLDNQSIEEISSCFLLMQSMYKSSNLEPFKEVKYHQNILNLVEEYNKNNEFFKQFNEKKYKPGTTLQQLVKNIHDTNLAAFSS